MPNPTGSYSQGLAGALNNQGLLSGVQGGQYPMPGAFQQGLLSGSGDFKDWLKRMGMYNGS